MNREPTQQQTRKPRLTRDALVASICGFVVVLMVGASYAAVPFYNWFCRVTGFNGTTQVATSLPSSAPLARKIAVRFGDPMSPVCVPGDEPTAEELRAWTDELMARICALSGQEYSGVDAVGRT